MTKLFGLFMPRKSCDYFVIAKRQHCKCYINHKTTFYKKYYSSGNFFKHLSYHIYLKEHGLLRAEADWGWCIMIKRLRFCWMYFFFLAFGHTAKKEKAEKQTLGEYFSKEKESTQTFHVFISQVGGSNFSTFLNGRVIKLGLTCLPPVGKPCLLFKLRGSERCKLSLLFIKKERL